MKAYAEYVGIAQCTHRFLVEATATRLPSDATPAILQLQDGDVIDVFSPISGD